MLGEITMLQQLKHRNIMRLYDWWFDKQHQVRNSKDCTGLACGKLHKATAAAALTQSQS